MNSAVLHAFAFVCRLASRACEVRLPDGMFSDYGVSEMILSADFEEIADWLDAEASR